MCALFLRAFLCCVFILLCNSESSALAYEYAYMPVDSKILSKRVKQKLVIDPLEKGIRRIEGRSTIEITKGGRLLAHGSDKAGKPWTFASSAWIGCASAWSSDLDKNGEEDLILVMRTGGTGLSPTAQLVVLMFESNGRPFPWCVNGYFEIDEHGVKDFLDCDYDGHAELVRQSIDDGYWITSFYETANCRWRRLDSIEGIGLPLYTRFSQSSNHTAITPPDFRHPQDEDLSNVPGIISGKSPSRVYLDTVECSNAIDSAADLRLLLSNGKRLRPRLWNASMCVVLDEPQGRRMAALSEAQALRKLVNEIALRKLPITYNAMCQSRSRGIKNTSSPSEYIFAQTRTSAFTATSPRNSSRDLSIALSFNRELP